MSLIDISNKLTKVGIKSVYDKLFDPSVTYNRAFYSDEVSLLKLRLYNSEDVLITQSSDEKSSVTSDNWVVLSYGFIDIQLSDIECMRIYNGPTLMVEIKDLSGLSGSFDAERINLLFQLKENTLCLPKLSLTRMTKSLINLNNDKITKLYVGNGDPDLSGNSAELTSLINSYNFDEKVVVFEYLGGTDSSYTDDTSGVHPIISDQIITKDATPKYETAIKIIVEIPPESSPKNITELSVGYDESNDYACTLQRVMFNHENQMSKYRIELIINLIMLGSDQ